MQYVFKLEMVVALSCFLIVIFPQYSVSSRIKLDVALVSSHHVG